MIKKISWLLILCMILSLPITIVSCGDDAAGGAQTSGDLIDGGTTSGVGTTSSTSATKAEVRGKKPVDIYIVAGQSNASGHTQIDENKISDLWDKYDTGVSSVMYRGRAEYNYKNGVQANDVMWTSVQIGFGYKEAYMGPEVGMAAILSEYYTEEFVDNGGPAAGIVKYAHGGTSLFANTSGENSTTGNWLSPSGADILGVTYTEDGLHGGLYRGMLDYVENSIDELRAEGYDDIQVKGLFWMQGESDRHDPDKYKKLLACFISDVREELGERLGQDLSKMPFIIGEISRTSGDASPANVTTNERFIAMQKSIVSLVPNCHIINSSKYDINAWVNNQSQPVGTDHWHWNAEDMFHIGEEVGECILNKILKVK